MIPRSRSTESMRRRSVMVTPKAKTPHHVEVSEFRHRTSHRYRWLGPVVRLLRTESNHRIDLRRATRRQPARD